MIRGCGHPAVTPDPYISRVTYDITIDSSTYLAAIDDKIAGRHSGDKVVIDSWISLQGLEGARDPASLESRIARLTTRRVTLSAHTNPRYRSYVPAFLVAIDLVDRLARIDIETPDGETYPLPPPGPFGDIDPASFTNRLNRLLHHGDQTDGEPNRKLRQRLLTDARDLSPEMRLAMEVVIETGAPPDAELRTLTLADLTSVVSHPAVAVVAMEALHRDARAFEPVIAESNGRLVIVGDHRQRIDPPQFIDLTENIAYHAARYLQRVEARGDGHPDLAAIRRPLEPIALRVLPDRSAADDVLQRLDRARNALRDSAPRDFAPVGGPHPALASRAQACADAVFTLATMDLAAGDQRGSRRRRPSR